MNYLMNYKEYGDTSNPTIMLIHGEFLSAWNYDLIIDQLKDRYHILLPLLDGHQGSKEHFISIEHIAKKIIEDINNHYDGQLALIGGLSLGGQILCEMLSIKDDICQYAIIESADVMKEKSFVAKPKDQLSYRLSLHNYHLNRKQKKQYKESSKIDKEDFIKINEAMRHYVLKETIANTKAKVYVEVGSKEKNYIPSCTHIHHTIKKSQMIIMYRYAHGDFSLNHVSSYTNLITKLMKQKNTRK